MTLDGISRSMILEKGKVITNSRLARDIYSMEIAAPGIASTVQPGQFVNILISQYHSPLLRRPMSVASARTGQIRLIYKVIGYSTKKMTGWTTGHIVDLLGPLGNGWTVPEDTHPVLVGGGVGIAPINYLHEQLKASDRKHQLLMGARSKADHYLVHDPDRSILLTTDDGTLGIQGTVLDGLIARLEEIGTNNITIFACGPGPMLQAIKDFALTHNYPCQLATEEMMGCGFGICQGCSVEMKIDEGTDQPGYRRRFKLACVDGPVFWAQELA